jgi:hypothetical protein
MTSQRRDEMVEKAGVTKKEILVSRREKKIEPFQGKSLISGTSLKEI